MTQSRKASFIASFRVLRARFDRHDLGAKQIHAEDVGLLPLDIDVTHVDDAVEPEARASGCRGDAMLARSRLGDDARLAHPAGEKDLAEHIVDLVCAGMIEFLALEIDFCAAPPAGSGGFLADMEGHPLGIIERARSPGIMGEQIVEFGLEGRIRLGGVVMLLKIEDQRHQGFGNEPAAENAKMPGFVGTGAKRIGPLGEHGRQPFSIAAQPLEHIRFHSTCYLPAARLPSRSRAKREREVWIAQQ